MNSTLKKTDDAMTDLGYPKDKRSWKALKGKNTKMASLLLDLGFQIQPWSEESGIVAFVYVHTDFGIRIYLSVEIEDTPDFYFSNDEKNSEKNVIESFDHLEKLLNQIPFIAKKINGRNIMSRLKGL